MTFSSWGKMNDKELKREIEELEKLRLKRISMTLEKMLEAERRGRRAYVRPEDIPSLKKRYLEALWVYEHLGLTPNELFKKRNVWLLCPGDEKKITKRAKTVSVFLHRLQSKGLASRKREGRIYRYFITKHGVNRLGYYESRSQKNKKN